MAKYEPTTSLEMDIAEILGSAASKARVDKLVELIESDSENEFDVVGIKGSRVAVEHVEVYGLWIGLDANGNAATIESDYGLEIVP